MKQERKEITHLTLFFMLIALALCLGLGCSEEVSFADSSTQVIDNAAFEETNFYRKKISPQLGTALDVVAADFDGDGELDVASSTGPNSLAPLLWYRHSYSDEFNYPRVIPIHPSISALNIIEAADLDNDGDMDLVAGSESGPDLFWYENTDGKGNFALHSIKLNNELSSQLHAKIPLEFIYTVDLDGDNALDLLVSNDDQVTWFKNTNGRSRFMQQTIITSYVNNGTAGLQPIDLDNDNDLDILVSFQNLPELEVRIEEDNTVIQKGKILWFENNGQGQFGAERLITDEYAPRVIVAGDFDNDQDIDIAFAGTFCTGSSSNYGLFFIKNTRPETLFRVSSIKLNPYKDNKTSDIGHILTRLYSVDFDNNGLLDIVWTTIADGRVRWFKNIDGTNFDLKVVNESNELGFYPPLHLADIDNDQDTDILMSMAKGGKARVLWFENENNSDAFLPSQDVFQSSTMWVNEIMPVHMGDDTNIDLLGIFDTNVIAWYENKNSKYSEQYGQFLHKANIVHQQRGAVYRSVYAAHLNQDNNLDIIAADSRNNQIVYFTRANDNSYNPPVVLSDTVDNPRYVYAADLDNDLDTDVLCASQGNNKVIWYENLDNSGQFEERILSDTADGATFVQAADMDADEDLDVVFASQYNRKIAWFENRNNIFSQEKVIAIVPGQITSIFLEDMGNPPSDKINPPNENFKPSIDIVYVTRNYEMADYVAWIPNQGNGVFDKEYVIYSEDVPIEYSGSGDGFIDVWVADMDGDHELDIITALELVKDYDKGTRENRILWFENTSNGFFKPHTVSTAGSNVLEICAADINNDGKTDIISGGRDLAWYKQN